MYQLNEEQRNNLLRFLDRVPLKGVTEVLAFNDIIVALSKKEGGEKGGE